VEKARLQQQAAEGELARLVREIFDRTPVRPDATYTANVADLCKRHRISHDRGNAITKLVWANWRKARP
jgi:hypothetical protein